MNIVLIHPFIKVRDVETYLSEPLGLLCLGTYVEQEFPDVKVTVLDLYALGARTPSKRGEFHCLGIDDEEEIGRRLSEMQPDLVGITCNFTAYANDTLEAAQIVRKHYPQIPIVVGGAHPTIEAESTLNLCPAIDFVIRGEGEIAFANLIRHLKGEIPRQDVKGLAYRINGHVVLNEKQELMDDVDVLPIPSGCATSFL